MSDTAANGSTGPTDDEREYSEDLPDGSVSGNATVDPDQDSDVDAGGEPADPE